VILEAWDAGAIPVACSTSAGAAEIISAADGGLLYAEQSADSLSNAILEALRLPSEKAVELIDNGRSWTSRHCDPTDYGAVMAKILSTAAKRHRS
jgi:glycosyltransferase involved in cell wall biosynthesis